MRRRLSPEEVRAHLKAMAREREQAELAAQNPRPLVVDAATIQRRNAICADILSYYELLVSCYLPDDALKRPPEEGWAFVNAERFAFLDKTDAVIDLYKHLPYISHPIHKDSYKIYYRTTCVDYTGEYFRNQHIRDQDGSMEPPQYYEQMDGEPTWPERLDDPRHIAVLAKTLVSTDRYILIDTRDGKVAEVLPRDEEDSVSTYEYDNIGQLIDEMTETFRELSMIPVTPTDLIDPANTYLPDEDVTRIKKLFHRHGWFTAEYDKNSCMREVGQIWEAFLQNR